MEPNHNPPSLDKKVRLVILVAAGAIPLFMLGHFFLPVLNQFYQDRAQGRPGAQLPLLLFGGFFLVMVVVVIISVVKGFRQLGQPAGQRTSSPSNQQPATNLAASIFMVLFSLPFAGFGVFALVQAAHKFQAGQSAEAGKLAIFGLIFAGVGFGLMFVTLRARKGSVQTNQKMGLNPDKPWLWREDWAAGRVHTSTRVPAKFMLLWAIGALVITMPAVHAIPRELAKSNPAILIVLVFPIVSLGMLGYLALQWRAHRRYGTCVFEMGSVPGVLGSTLEGVIQTGARLQLEHGLHLKLLCVRRTVTGSGKNQNVTENILWQEEKVLAPQTSLPEPEPGHSAIPVYFKLPADQPACANQGREAILWRLEARAKMSGPTFSVLFEVPVFHVAGVAPAAADEPDPTAPLQMAIEDLRRDEDSRIQVTDGPAGREFYFPAARYPGNAAAFTGITLVFGGASYGMFRAQAPLLFPIVFGLIATLMTWGCFNMWLRSNRVTIDRTTARAVTRWLLFSRTRSLAVTDLVRAETKAGMTSGQTVYYDLQLITSVGQRITVASYLANQPEAEWLAREMTRALGRS